MYQEHLTVRSELGVLNQIQRWFEQFCSRRHPDLEPLPLEQQYRLNLALAEGFTNAVRHAHAGLPIETPIQIHLKRDRDCLEIRIWDQGNPFNPDLLEEPKPGTLRQGGYGWFLLRRLADQVCYDRHHEQNCLVIRKYFAASVS